jgi:hypothetical protein
MEWREPLWCGLSATVLTGLERPLHSEGLAAGVSRIRRRPRLTMLLSRRRGGPRLLRLSHADGMLVPACGGGSRLGRSECATRSKCFGRSGYAS